MQKVVHASLHGNAYAVEEAGYEALRAYLEAAAAQLAADPDHAEILGDLEQAIADKCARHLGPHKTVVTEAEMKQVLEEMGPVGPTPEVGPGAPSAAPPPPPAAPVRRLYRVLEGGVFGGLCNGLGAYYDVDANVVRAVFVILTLVTHGAWALVYLVLMFVVPAAGTPEERAAASGLQFGAQQLIDEAKRHYARLEKELSGPWAKWKRGDREWRERRREARRTAREARREWRARQAEAAEPPPAAPGPANYAQQVAAGLTVPVAAFASAFLTVAWLQLSAQLVVTGRLLGWSPGLPLWASLVILLVVRLFVGHPLGQVRAALHRAPHPGGAAWLAAWDGILWLGFLLLLLWLAWHAFPDLSALAHDLPGAVDRVRASWHAAR
ncbi:MAG TPA: PspC domain-containing protein [Anaeromyxobacteraceae bacterium]|nr:PspC domain-containing protein [Anaeromyxobacteraceae bacterium]